MKGVGRPLERLLAETDRQSGRLRGSGLNLSAMPKGTARQLAAVNSRRVLWCFAILFGTSLADQDESDATVRRLGHLFKSPLPTFPCPIYESGRRSAGRTEVVVRQSPLGSHSQLVPRLGRASIRGIQGAGGVGRIGTGMADSEGLPVPLGSPYGWPSKEKHELGT